MSIDAIRHLTSIDRQRSFQVGDDPLTGDLAANHFAVRENESSLRARESEIAGSGTRLWFGHTDGANRRRKLATSPVAVEKLVFTKFAKIKLLQDSI